MARKYDYNATRQLKSLEKYDFNSKTEKQVANYMAKKLETLGYKAPKYLKQGKIKPSQLDYHLDRMIKKLQPEVEKEYEQKLAKQGKSVLNEYKRNKAIDKNLEKYNEKVAQVHNEIDKMSVPSYIKDFLKGEQVYNETRDKYFEYEKAVQFKDKSNMHFKSLQEFEKFTRKLNKGLNVNSYIKSINDSTEYDSWKDSIYNHNVTKEFTPLDIEKINNTWNQLSAPEKIFVVKSELSQIKEKYEAMYDNAITEFEQDLVSNRYFSRLMLTMRYYLEKREE